MRNINRVVLTGGLAAEPDLHRTPAGTAVVILRIAFTTQQRLNGAWHDKANYVDVEVWGPQAESAARHLAKGRQVAVDGRLVWSEYESNGVRKQLHKVVADSVQFLPARQRVAEAGADTTAADEASQGVEQAE
jgi:single-strand DNA-binding protein